MIISLVGYRGTGKTTVATLLADTLRWGAIDTDDQIERAVGCSIAQLFADRGEEAFRYLEAQTIARLVRQHQRVLALGGGAILRKENRDAIRSAGPVIWLDARAETIYHRLAHDPTSVARRPNLTAVGGLEEIRQLLDQRRPLYDQCSDHHIQTDELDPHQIVDQIVQLLKLGAGPGDPRTA